MVLEFLWPITRTDTTVESVLSLTSSTLRNERDEHGLLEQKLFLELCWKLLN